MRKVWLVLTLAVLAAGGFYYWSPGRAPREVIFAKVRRETVVSTLSTNGKVEPVEFAAVRSAGEGSVSRLLVTQGARVTKGQVLAELERGSTQAELAAAETRVAQAQADLETFTRGGGTAALAEIDNSLRKAELDLEIARRELDATVRLVKKNAATSLELKSAEDRVRQIEQEMRGLENRRGSLLPAGGKQAAQAKLRDAESAVALARVRIEQASIRAPMDGVIYHLALRRGAYLRAGDLVAEVGKLERLRVLVYVDEPELGRVAPGMPVKITWDGQPEQSWAGVVEQMPTQITALGTRQVGEVRCLIPNESRQLPAGANINAEILSRQVTGALSIPKEALRREDGKLGVLRLLGNKVEWRTVKIGVSSLTRAEVLEGLQEGDAVALPTEAALASGEMVTPKFP
ncbi:MAG: efflux RND transporter periplasmic adaptor subunit [Acidobacteriia bacterium]|nr:efflux RND transporter periplasmic adaptor subunit [Terriglobia bacterium]